MLKHIIVVCVFCLAAFPAITHAQISASIDNTMDGEKITPQPNRVVVMYFHRTQRCPTCLKMGGYTEEAVLKGFENRVKEGTIEYRNVDFQDEKNAALTKAYKVGGPTLIVARVVDNKVKTFKNLKDIWTKNRDKDLFLKYVRDNIVAIEENDAETARR